ncbi:MAG: hypothetical protein WAW39_03725 [Prosthecobacter sp.]|uniref:hypothetical protein n=1 Tax=Prosthecobacter sp. TaxID=1965333 RepID=UPI003BAEF48A
MFPAASAPPRPWLRHAQRGTVLLLCLALGLQWALLQGIAWTGMFISFAREGSVIEAVEKTFDGQHACELCKKVKKGTQDSNNSSSSTQEDDATKGLHAVLVSPTVLIPPAEEILSFAPLCEVLISRKGMPEPPPPRRGQV